MNTLQQKNVNLLEVSHSPSVPISPSATPIDFLQIVTSLDQRRREAFESKNVIALSQVNHAGSPQAELDETMLKRIIKDNLSLEIVNSTIISVRQISHRNNFFNEVKLEVQDSVDGEERWWHVRLIQQPDGTWRFSLVTRAPL